MAVEMKNNSIQIVMTMAGHGKRMASISSIPKPLIDILGQPMFCWALQTLLGVPFGKVICVVLESHRPFFEPYEKLFEKLPIEFLYQTNEPKGQLCSALEAFNNLDAEKPLLIIGADTYVETNLENNISLHPDFHGFISVMPVPPGEERWSFARVGSNNSVVEVREKKRISNLASTGAYFFSRTQTFVEAARSLITSGGLVAGEFYVMPVYQQLIDSGMQIGISRDKMRDMGTPDALQEFLTNPPPFTSLDKIFQRC